MVEAAAAASAHPRAAAALAAAAEAAVLAAAGAVASAAAAVAAASAEEDNCIDAKTPPTGRRFFADGEGREKMRQRRVRIVGMVCLACLCMGVVDALIQPGYIAKSVVKLVLFLGLPAAYARYDRECDLRALFRAERRGVLLALGAGVLVYTVVLSAYLLLRRFFDFSALTGTLTSQTGVNRENFLWVALYISFVNSLLEEFFFRGFAFLTLQKTANRTFSYCFSAFAFAAYHIAMMIGWFSPVLIALAMIGLFLGGLLFDRYDEGAENIYLSWLVHMFANFATNTVGFLLFSLS